MLDELTPAHYVDVFEQLEGNHVRYVVIGGVAGVLQGHVRPVADLDMVIDPAPDEARRALHALSASGFVPSIPLPLSALTVMRMFDQSSREVDVFVRYLIPFEEMWSDSMRVRVCDRLVRVASLEHLIRAKRFNTTPHDIQDLEALLALTKSRDPSSDIHMDDPAQSDSK
jgi:hypothetical protein